MEEEETEIARQGGGEKDLEMGPEQMLLFKMKRSVCSQTPDKSSQSVAFV